MMFYQDDTSLSVEAKWAISDIIHSKTPEGIRKSRLIGPRDCLEIISSTCKDPDLLPAKVAVFVRELQAAFSAGKTEPYERYWVALIELASELTSVACHRSHRGLSMTTLVTVDDKILSETGGELADRLREITGCKKSEMSFRYNGKWQTIEEIASLPNPPAWVLNAMAEA